MPIPTSVCTHGRAVHNVHGTVAVREAGSMLPGVRVTGEELSLNMNKVGRVISGRRNSDLKLWNVNSLRGLPRALVSLGWGLCVQRPRFLGSFLWVVEIPQILGVYILNANGGL